MTVTHPRILSIALLASLACSPSGGDAITTTAGASDIRRELEAELRRLVAGSIVPITIDSSRVIYHEFPSRIVPGLTYLGAYSVPREVPHGTPYAIAALRGGAARVIRRPSDLGVVIGDWRPRSEHDAVSLCAEAARFGTDQRDRFAPPFVIGATDDTLPSFLSNMDELRRRTTAPRVEAAGGNGDAWTVTMWVVERGITHSYRCALRSNARGSTIELVVVDSIPEVGYMTEG